MCQDHETHAAASTSWAASRVSYLTLATLEHSGCHGSASFKRDGRGNPGHWHGGSDVPQLEAADSFFFLRARATDLEATSQLRYRPRKSGIPFLASSLKLRQERG